ncbi:hypothetical protein BaRGS_00033875 [Batillaria attramentaria]|uniref:Spondin-like TSP1 domain-containing protein n=1 Tax=Batillaria attramentaria TaxID=370345 RepID=A0ABD0JJC9_9CAEN
MIQFWSRGVPDGPSMGYGHLNSKVIRHFGWSAILLLVYLFTDTHSQNVRFQWVTGSWGPCQHSTCGYGGLQYRDVRCQMPSGLPVLPNNCESALRPTDTQQCYKPCADGESPSRGDEFGRTPSSRGEDSRPDKVILTQPREGLNLGDSSVEWVVSQWSSCRLAPGVSTCGRNNGVRYRNVTCERKDRRVLMDGHLCARVERKPSSSEPCELLCRQDCIVTPFSAWSSCDITCHVFNRTRTRRIVVPPRHRGDHCPPFSEMLPCDNCSETFTYHLGKWGPCTLIGNTYRVDGKVHPLVGYRSREITCLQSKGTLTALP